MVIINIVSSFSSRFTLSIGRTSADPVDLKVQRYHHYHNQQPRPLHRQPQFARGLPAVCRANPERH